MNVLIVGGGRAVYFLCRSFLAKGHHVTVIDREADECVQLARRLKVTAVLGDGSSPALLEDAGVRGADAVIAVTPNDHDNLAVCQIAALQFGALRVLALVNDPDNEEVFKKLGVSAFSTTRIIASLIEERTALDEITNLIPVGEGKVNVTEVSLRTDAPVVGKEIRELELPADCVIAVVLRDGRALIPHGSTRLLAGDRVVLITLPESYGPVLRAVTGETG